MENKRADSGKALSISECRKINLAMKGTEQQEDQDGMSVSISMKQHKKEDTKFSNFCQCIKASIGCVFIVLVVFGLLAYVIVNETEKRVGTAMSETTRGMGGNIEVCGADSFMLRDGVCDELTNTEKCHWDGGDCCLDISLKDESLCRDCQCRWTVDLEFHSWGLDIKRLQFPMDHFNPVHIEKTVIKMASKDACDALCTHPDVDFVVNAWKYDNEEKTCTCAWLTSQTCDWDPLIEDTFFKETQTVAYIQLSKILPCSCQRIDYKIPYEEMPLAIQGNVATLSSWHCQKECQVNPQCTAFSWSILTTYCVMAAIHADNSLVVSASDWISGVADCDTLNDTIKLPPSDILIVTSGTTAYDDEPLSHSEVFDISNANLECKLSKNLSLPLKGATGGVISLENGTQVPIICGGFASATREDISDECHIVGSNLLPFATLSHARGWLESAVVQGGKALLVTGGSAHGSWYNSMDYISFDSFENTASNLPIHIVGHCIVTVNHNYVLLISRNNQEPWLYNMQSMQWTLKSAALMTARHFPACGMILDSSEESPLITSYIVIIGGNDGQSKVDTTELFEVTAQEDIDDELDYSSWKHGPMLPYMLSKAAVSTTSNKKKLVLAGGKKDADDMPSSDILLFQCLNGFCSWKQWGKLKQPRLNAVALILPGYMDEICT